MTKLLVNVVERRTVLVGFTPSLRLREEGLRGGMTDSHSLSL